MINREDRLWYKDAVIYQLHIKAFRDGDDDGIGDFAGLTRQLDYIQELGVTALWLLPFYPSPLRDDGYDIADYRQVNPNYGTMRDFKAFLKECHARGLRVITELVINHTSDQHKWFQRARRAKPGSPHRDYYVWSDTDQAYDGTRIIFCDTEKSNWTWDSEAKAYFWHRFYSHQPDLNFDNPRVVREVLNVMHHWLEMGVDGLRLDAVPYLIEREGTNNENLPETHDILKLIREEIDGAYADRMLLAEANQWPEDVLPYFGDPAKGGDECHMAFHFPLMPRIYMALAQEDRHPIADILRQTPEIPPDCQWAIFLRNHDELTLEMVTSDERDYLWKVYAADHRMRINLGIRRRLAPLLGNDRRKIELLNSLLMSMPGTPVVYYGDEIGMGDNIYLGDRDGVRTPMQWSPDRNGGFSRADPARLYLPAIQDPIYGFAAVNVEAQSASPASLLNWMKRLIATRREYVAFGRGSLRFLYPGNRKIVAYLRHLDAGDHGAEQTILCVANLSRSAQAVELDLRPWKGRVPLEMLGRTAFPPIGDLPYLLTLPAYGFYWFALTVEAELPRWHEPAPEPVPDLPTLVFRKGWGDFVGGGGVGGGGGGGGLGGLAQDVLPAFINRQRWTAAGSRSAERVVVETTAHLPGPGDGFLICLVRAERSDGADAARHLLPLAVNWEQGAGGTGWPLLPYAVAKARRGALPGGVFDAEQSDDFARALVAQLQAGGAFPASNGEIRFNAASGLTADLWGPDEHGDPPERREVRRLSGEWSNTALLVGDRLVVKLMRRLAPSLHPELEMSRHLTEVARLHCVPPLLGTMDHVDSSGTVTTLAVFQGFVRNQGDGWSVTLDFLVRELEELRLGIGVNQPGAADHGEIFGHSVRMAAALGQRTAELHRALSVGGGDPDFESEPITAADLSRWTDRARRRLTEVFGQLRRRLGALSAAAEADARSLLDRQTDIDERLATLLPTEVDAVKTRIHGDYHLGQVLRAQNDWCIIDFEGEISRPIEERREKRSPLLDVAGMLRSFDYAVWAALQRLGDGHGEGSAANIHAIEMAHDWERRSVVAFLSAYRATIEGCHAWPRDEGAGRSLLAFCLMERVIEELAWEMSCRPSWIGIPLKGMLALLERRGGGMAVSH